MNANEREWGGRARHSVRAVGYLPESGAHRVTRPTANASFHCYPAISHIFAKIFSAALTQRRKDAKMQRGNACSFGVSVPNLCVFASLRLCVEFPRLRFAALRSLRSFAAALVWLRLAALRSFAVLRACLLFALAAACFNESKAETIMKPVEKQITHRPGGKILTNTRVWSPDGEWIVYDTRSDPAGEVFDGSTIAMVRVRTGEVKELYHSTNGAPCGVASFNPQRNQIVFILGPENPTPDWSYGPFHRQGAVLDLEKLRDRPGSVQMLDARDLTPPFTPGALRGGTHLHVWDGAGEWVAFTYEDHLLAQFQYETSTNEINLRNVGVCIPGQPVRVSKGHPRNHDAEYFSVIVTRTVANPRPGSDEIKRASEEAWVGTNGYLRPDGTRQHRALAFQGRLASLNGETNSEVFIVDLPGDVTVAGSGPLAGTATRMPFPPKGAINAVSPTPCRASFPACKARAIGCVPLRTAR